MIDDEPCLLQVRLLREALLDVRVGVQYLLVYGCERATCQTLIAHIDTALDAARDVAKAHDDPA